jgi:hypothetical protein
VAVSVVLLSGCVAHPVGPARTFSKYEGKAVTTAKSALSAVESARLTAEAASGGNAFGPYAASVISEAEESARGVRATFASVQPPDPKADALASQLDALLGATVDDLTAVRVAARRGELDRLSAIAAPLAADSERLQAFMDSHK